MEIITRAMTLKDIPAIVALWNSQRSETLDCRTGEVHDGLISRYLPNQAFVVEREGKLVGWFTLSIVPRSGHDRELLCKLKTSVSLDYPAFLALTSRISQECEERGIATRQGHLDRKSREYAWVKELACYTIESQGSGIRARVSNAAARVAVDAALGAAGLRVQHK